LFWKAAKKKKGATENGRKFKTIQERGKGASKKGTKIVKSQCPSGKNRSLLACFFAKSCLLLFFPCALFLASMSKVSLGYLQNRTLADYLIVLEGGQKEKGATGN
jgi:hypothetical protein